MGDNSSRAIGLQVNLADIFATATKLNTAVPTLRNVVDHHVHDFVSVVVKIVRPCNHHRMAVQLPEYWNVKSAI